MSVGTVVNVQEVVTGSELAANASAGAGSITVEDPTDFQPDGGELLIVAEEKSYSAVDEDTGVITLDGTLASSYVAEDFVFALPSSVERFAYVIPEGDDETLQARIPHALYDRLPVGIRDENADEVELVEMTRTDEGELVVADVLERVPSIDAGFLDPDSTVPPAALTDGIAPAVSPTPTLYGGVRSIFVTWVPIANHDPVTYEVHVSTSSGFTPSAGTYAGESRGSLFVIRHLPGTTNPPANATTYFVRIVARDADGAGPASTEDSATPVEGMADAIIADFIAANNILAEHLEAVMVIASTFVAGALDGGRVEFGFATDEAMGGMLGIHAMAPDGQTLTFMVDGETGEVYIRGSVDWGINTSDPALAASRLTAENVIELFHQPAGSFQVPTLVQAVGGNATPAGTVSALWQRPTTKGNLLLAVLHLYDVDGTPPTPTTPSGWTLVPSSTVTQDASKMLIYKIENAATRSGTQSITLNDSCFATLQLFEYAGVGLQDLTVVTASGDSTSPAATGGASTTQASELWLAVFGNYFPISDASIPESISNGFAPVRMQGSPTVDVLDRQLVAAKNVVSVGTPSVAATLAQAEDWIVELLTFKAKPEGVETPDAERLRIYAKDHNAVALPYFKDEQGNERQVGMGALYAPVGTPWTKAVSTTLERTLMESANNLPAAAAPFIPDRTGCVLRVVVAGSYDHASAGGGLTLRVKAGTTTLDSFAISAPGSNQSGQGFMIEATVVVKTAGATGIISGCLSRFAAGAASTYSARGFPVVTGLNIAGGLKLDVTAQYGSSSASNGMTVEMVTVEQLF